MHLKVFTKLHDSISRIQKFPASDRVWGSNISLKHDARQNIGGLSINDKSHKNRGHLGTFFSNSSWFGVFEWKISKILDSVEKIEDFGRQFLVKTGFFDYVRGENKGSKVWQLVHTIVYMWVIPHWFGILSLELGPGPTGYDWISPCMLGYSWSQVYGQTKFIEPLYQPF